MIDCFACDLCAIFSDLNSQVEHLLRIPDQNVELPAESTKHLHRLRGILYLEKYRHIFQDDDLHLRLWRLSRELENEHRFSPATLAREFQGIMFQAQRQLALRKFAYIPSPNDQYFECEKLFGEKVYLAFERARLDIKDAGNCYAAELYTACVFHLMRVAEYGLRAIADKLNVTIIDKKQPIPLEYGDWNKVITGIEAKIEVTRRLANDATKQALLKRYSEGTDRIGRARDIWRNDLSHTRTRIDEPEANLALVRVTDLMQFLADTLEMPW